MKQKHRRPLKELNLLDRFLFDEVMEDTESVKIMLDIIFEKSTQIKYPPQTEKEQRTTTKDRGIRLDVYAVDEEDTIYDVEPQNRDEKNLPKRSRLYQGIIDSKLLPPGTVDFNNMNDVFIIVIMPFDLFGEGLYRYTFRMKCDERPRIALDDGAVRIFLNSHGEHQESVSTELIEFLEYMEQTTEEVVQKCTSQKIHRLHERVSRIKASEETEIKYMRLYEERELERLEAIAEGKALGREEGERDTLRKIIEKKVKKKYSVSEIAEMLELDESEVREIINELDKDCL